MNKQFMYLNGNIIVSDEKGMKPAIPYRDNIEDILILENEIEFLEKRLKEDSEKLETKKSDREFRNKDSKKIHEYEFEHFVYLYEAYKALNGNSFIDKIYSEVKTWEIVL